MRTKFSSERMLCARWRSISQICRARLSALIVFLSTPVGMPRSPVYAPVASKKYVVKSLLRKASNVQCWALCSCDKIVMYLRATIKASLRQRRIRGFARRRLAISPSLMCLFAHFSMTSRSCLETSRMVILCSSVREVLRLQVN